MFRLSCFLLSLVACPAQGALIASWNLNEPSGDLVDSGLGTPLATARISSLGNGILYRQTSVPAGSYGAIQVSAEQAAAFGSAVDFWTKAQSMGSAYVPAPQDQKLRSLNPEGAFTVMAWVRPDILPTGESQRVISVSGISDAERGWAFGIKGDNILLFTAVGLADQPCRIATPWKPGTWHHIAMTYQKGMVSFYFDGKFLATVNQPFERAKGESEVILGSRPSRQDQLCGAMDEIQVFNTALTEERIRNAAVR